MYANQTLLTELHHLPSLAYFTCLLPYETIRLEANEFYEKQSYRNRCYILSSQQVDRLTIPVRKPTGQVRYTELKIDYTQPWLDKYWRTWCTAYGKAPYFTYLAASFEAVLFAEHTHLFDLNVALLKTCLRLLQLEKRIEYSEDYKKTPEKNLVDVRRKFAPQNRLKQGNYYQPVPYTQVFNVPFQPNLSILDLLFCEGTNAPSILKASCISTDAQAVI